MKTDNYIRKNLYNTFSRYAKKLQRSSKKEYRELGKRLETKINELVEWYIANKRDMTPEEFKKIVET